MMADLMASVSHRARWQGCKPFPQVSPSFIFCCLNVNHQKFPEVPSSIFKGKEVHKTEHSTVIWRREHCGKKEIRGEENQRQIDSPELTEYLLGASILFT